MLDLVAYRYGLKYGYARPERRIPLWLPPGGIARLAMLGSALAFGSEGSDGGEAFWSGVFDLHEYDPSTVLDIDDIQVAFVSTQHFVPCYAMRVSGPDGRSLAYTADTGAIADLIAPFTGVSTVLAEGTERDHADRPLEHRGHLTPFDAGELARETSASRLIITHLWSERDDDEVIEDAARAYRGEIIVAKPGMSLDV
jgi:ribonuclease BN (tRNA processing enzyme)